MEADTNNKLASKYHDKKFLNIDKNKNEFQKDKMEKLLKNREKW